MECRDPQQCRCLCHVSPATHVPCCPFHRMPLVSSVREPGKGFCRSCEAAEVHAHITPDQWAWIHRDVFSGWDVPPWNGYHPMVLDQEGRPV